MTHNDEYLTPFASDFGDDDLGEGDDDIKTPEPGEDGDGGDGIKPPAPGAEDGTEEDLGIEEY